jgi:hypothetical protein
VQLPSKRKPQIHIAGSRIGQMTSGRWRMNSHLIAFSGKPGAAHGAE